MNGDLLIAVGFVCFTAGLYAGGWLTDYKWRSKSLGPQRMLSGRRFFHVVEDGDRERAEEVLRNI